MSRTITTLAMLPLALAIGCSSPSQPEPPSADPADPVESMPAEPPEPAQAIAPRDPDAYVARGNEPGWRLEVGAQTATLLADYGDLELTAAVPEPDVEGGRRVYRFPIEIHTLQLELAPGPCFDDMTGMPYPDVARVELDERTLNGCGGDPLDLLGDEDWRIEDIAGRSPVAGSTVSIQFDRDGRFFGQASCNRYSGGYELTGEGFEVTPIAATKMACEPERMDQETQVLELLGALRHFSFDDSGALVLTAADGRTLTARR